MPFAIIAVTLLILASAYGVVATQVKESEDNADNVITELGSLEGAIAATESEVERGLGEIIFEISTDPEGGTLEKREKTFEDRAAGWMAGEFPERMGGVTITLLDYDTRLAAESLKLSTADSISEGFMPSYLRASGHFSARYTSDSGISTRTTEISTDGSCALPLVAEQGSLFENMISGDGSVLSQMMLYQLTALAQYRVLNGYGSTAEYGNMGTMSILTVDDVTAAYRGSLNVIELLTFRTSPDGGLEKHSKLDLADGLIAKNGYIEMDISAMYSQALISVTDDLVLKWIDYFYGNLVCNAVDSLLDFANNTMDSIRGFFNGKNNFSAGPYINTIMTNNGYDVSRYQYLNSGKSFSVSIPSTVQQASVNGNKQSLDIDGFSVNVPYPNVDLMAWHGISKFKSDYRAETNEVREWFRSIITDAAVQIGQSKAFGTIRFSVDAYDDEAFMDTVSRMVAESIDNGNANVERIMTSAIANQTIIDPFYAKIYEVIAENAYAIYGADTFEESIRSSIERSISDKLDEKYGTVLDPTVAARLADSVMGSYEISNVVNGYRALVSETVRSFDALNNVPGGQSGAIKKICTAIVKGGLTFEDMFVDVPLRIKGLCAETAENLKINAYYGVTEVPDTDRFLLVDSGGNTSVEKLTVTHALSPKIVVKGPNDNLQDNIHYVGFNDNTGASYSSAFTVQLTDAFRYTAASAGTLEHSMKIDDSSFTGSVGVDIDIKVVVASGWGLAGIRDYKASNNFLSDVWNVLIKILEPILEPLRKVFSMIMDALSVLNSALMEISKYVAKIVEKLYSALMDPLEAIKNFIEEKLSRFFDSVLEGAVDAVQAIVGIDLNKQTVGFSFMGFTITFTTKMNTWVKDTKTLITVTMGCTFDKISISGSLTVKQKGAGSTKQMLLDGSLEVSGKDWAVKASFDPLMKSTRHMITMSGTVKGVKFDVLMPDLVQYKQIDLTLSDIPSVAAVLSNIPVPIPGMKASIDAGINLKYNIPFETGILINEFELNPAGEDKGAEWVEIYNATYSTEDLDGYTIHAGSNPTTKVYRISGLTLAPGQRELIYLPGSFLNNSGSSLLSSGETVILKSPTGEVVDKTPAKKDSTNNEFTWQRAADAASDWVFASGTPGTVNGGGVVGGEMMKAQIIKIFSESATKTLGKMGTLKSTGDLSEFFKVAIQDAIDTAIEKLAGCLVEASIFISLDITDATSTTCLGMRVALSIGSDLIEDGLKYLVGEIESLLFNIENPYGLQPKTIISDDLFLGVTVYMGMTAPKFLKNLDSYPKTKIGVHVDTNVSGLMKLIGKNMGTWKVNAGVLLMDCPSEIIPSALGPDKDLNSDLWLVRATFVPA
ncbi:MAG: lamin tail domain-containing protein [Candidatus Methanoplasma sp.]|jgi:hypothetical protein|nr:lamin tail domain-containing protein [Candidatus Methanoplasma sp.]